MSPFKKDFKSILQRFSSIFSSSLYTDFSQVHYTHNACFIIYTEQS